MSDQSWAAVLGITPEEAARWLEGEHAIARDSNTRLVMLHGIITALGRSLSGKGIADWLHQEQLELNGRRPIDWLGSDQSADGLLLAARRAAARYHGVDSQSAYWPS